MTAKMSKIRGSSGLFNVLLCNRVHWCVKILSPSKLMVIVPLTVIIMFLARNNHVPRDREQKITNASDVIANELREKKVATIRKFAWSNELNDWTIESADDVKQETDLHNPKAIWPEDCNQIDSCGDRIINQLLSGSEENNKVPQKIFKIKPPSHLLLPTGQQLFIEDQCSIDRCSITYDSNEADAIIFQNSEVMPKDKPGVRSHRQIWVAYFLESPCHTFDRKFKRQNRGNMYQFNWTASYRSDSDLVTPYSKFVPYQDRVREFKWLKELGSQKLETRAQVVVNGLQISEKQRKLIENKKPGVRVAWFASNCNAANRRLEYANDLAEFVQVDIYGKCGNLTCDKWNQTECLEMLNSDYKFYLAFENSNCVEYITEKLYKNALGHNDPNYMVLPIVMGPSRSDYEKLAPPNSFIHVDDFESPKELANYLRLLDSNDELYYSYFRWKTLGQFIDTKLMCRVCSLLHQPESKKNKFYEDIEGWWNNYNHDSSGNHKKTTACDSF